MASVGQSIPYLTYWHLNKKEGITGMTEWKGDCGNFLRGSWKEVAGATRVESQPPSSALSVGSYGQTPWEEVWNGSKAQCLCGHYSCRAFWTVYILAMGDWLGHMSSCSEK